MNEVLGVILGLLLVMVCIFPIFTGQTIDLSALNTFLESAASSTSSTQSNNSYSNSSGYSGSQYESSSNSYNSYSNNNSENKPKYSQAYINQLERNLEDAKRDLEWAQKNYEEECKKLSGSVVISSQLLRNCREHVQKCEERLREARGY